MANETLTTGASRSISNYNSDDILNIARLAWTLSGNAEFQKKQYGSDSIDMFSGNRAGMMKVAQDYLNGVTTRVPELDTALDKAVQQHFGANTTAPATGAGGGDSTPTSTGTQLQPGYEIDPNTFNVKLPNGQTITRGDPNYSTYINQAISQKNQTSRQTQQNITLPNGQQITPQDTETYKYFQQHPELTVQQQSPQGNTGTQVDQTGWTDAMKQTYDALNKFIQGQNAIGKRVNPNITIDEATIQKFKDTAKADAAPYYKQLFDQADQDLKLAFQRTGQDYESEKRKLELSYGQNLESTQGAYARKGLEFSSDRARAEQNLANQAQSGLSALQTTSQRAYENTGQQAERNIGSSLFPQTNSNVNTYTPSIGKPGVYGFQQTGSRSLFNPTGNVTGELQRKQLFDVNAEVKNMTEAKRQLRSSQYL